MQPIIIKTLGEFSISHADNTIAEKDKRSKKMWTLLKYLTAFKDRSVTQSELIKILWGYGEGEDKLGASNPSGALKTQLHRMRNAMSVLNLGAGVELVVSFAGTYALNNSLEYIIDSVEFEENYKKSLRDDISEKEQIYFVKRAFVLYKGDFLKNSPEESWIMPTRVHYHNIFTKIVHKLIDALYKHKQNAELINICRQALLIDSADQKTHMLLVKALAASNDLDSAKKQYKYVMDMLYNELGVNPIPELKNLYKETLEKDSNVENNLEIIKQKLKESGREAESGAFYCEQEVFKSIYRLKLRDAKRTGEKVQICLITVRGKEGEELQPKLIIEEMKRLYECVNHSLRKNDTFARYSVSQYILMLPSNSNETAELVVERIINRYKEKNPDFLLDVDFKYIMANSQQEIKK